MALFNNVQYIMFSHIISIQHLVLSELVLA